MKIIAALMIVFAGLALYADEIHLKDGTVVRGEVKGTGTDTIIYRDETTFHAKELPLENTVRIEYPGGLMVNPHEKAFDDIYPKEGAIIKAKVLLITGDTVIAHGEREIMPRRIPLDELSKIVYHGGRTLSFMESSQAAKTAPPVENYPPPTHHLDGEMNLFFIILGGFGITRNADINSYTEQQAQRYLTHLQGLDAYWSGNSVSSTNNPYYPDINLEIEARFIDDIGIGLGISGGFSLIIPDTVEIRDSSGDDTVQFESLAYFAYCAATLYLKQYFAAWNSMSFYMLAGAGIGYYKGYVTITINEGFSGSHGTPDHESFEEDFSGSAPGYHGVVEFGVEQSPVALMAGLKVRRVEIDELSSGGRVMRLDNGSAASLKLNGAMIYAGIGLFM